MTPSYNQGQFIEETIRSVLLQGYPDLEYIIMDGGSKDDSVEIIKRYEKWLEYWISEPDEGQCQAINKGFAFCTGEINCWINSDDYYLDSAFRLVVDAFGATGDVQWVAGSCGQILLNGDLVEGWGKFRTDLTYWFVGPGVMQPGVFWRRELLELAGPLNEQFRYGFDYDLWLRFIRIAGYPKWVGTKIAYFRYHAGSKTVNNQREFHTESRRVRLKNADLLSWVETIIAWRLISEHSAFKLFNAGVGLSNAYESAGRMSLVIIAILHAPWIIFYRKTYSKLKYLMSKSFGIPR